MDGVTLAFWVFVGFFGLAGAVGLLINSIACVMRRSRMWALHYLRCAGVGALLFAVPLTLIAATTGRIPAAMVAMLVLSGAGLAMVIWAVWDEFFEWHG
jgi:hypothetical protein